MDAGCAIPSSCLPSGSLTRYQLLPSVAVNERQRFCTRLDSLRLHLDDVFQQQLPGFFALRLRNSASAI